MAEVNLKKFYFYKNNKVKANVKEQKPFQVWTSVVSSGTLECAKDVTSVVCVCVFVYLLTLWYSGVCSARWS